MKPASLLFALLLLLQACGKSHNTPSTPSESADLGKPYTLPIYSGPYHHVYTPVITTRLLGGPYVATSDSLIAIQASITSPQFFPAAGAHITNNQFTIVATDNFGGVNFIFTGSISGNTCSGTWVRGNYPISTGTFTAHRTL